MQERPDVVHDPAGREHDRDHRGSGQDAEVPRGLLRRSGEGDDYGNADTALHPGVVPVV